MAHTDQSRPDSGLGFQSEVLTPFQVVFSYPGPDADPDTSPDPPDDVPAHRPGETTTGVPRS